MPRIVLATCTTNICSVPASQPYSQIVWHITVSVAGVPQNPKLANKQTGTLLKGTTQEGHVSWLINDLGSSATVPRAQEEREHEKIGNLCTFWKLVRAPLKPPCGQMRSYCVCLFCGDSTNGTLQACHLAWLQTSRGFFAIFLCSVALYLFKDRMPACP